MKTSLGIWALGSMVTPYCFNNRVSSNTWYCLIVPPKPVTSITPFTCFNSGFNTQSCTALSWLTV